jgi:hypothetical protein
MMDNNFQIPLDLPDVRVLNVSKIEKGAWFSALPKEEE